MLQMVNQFCNNFVEVIEGTGEGMVSTDQLSVGAKINRLFHERLPLHIGRKYSKIPKIDQNFAEIEKLKKKINN